MPNAQVAIVNTALFQVNKAMVPDLSEASLRQNQAAAKIMQVLDVALETVLKRHGWLCALTYATLQPAVIAGDDNWKYASVYLMPAGALHVWEVRTATFSPILTEIDWNSFEGYPLLPQTSWEIGTIDTDDGAQLVLRANQTSELPISYVRKCSYDALDPHVADAVAFDAASRVGLTITGDKALAQALDAKAERKVLMAISTDAMQQAGQDPLAPSNVAMIRALSR